MLSLLLMLLQLTSVARQPSSWMPVRLWALLTISTVLSATSQASAAVRAMPKREVGALVKWMLLFRMRASWACWLPSVTRMPE
ncbi:MAG: hypothetical protein GFGODING_02305 [Flavobacteriales bacterium]|nr:hypothetical protein [Flavobacteriales bacterium]